MQGDTNSFLCEDNGFQSSTISTFLFFFCSFSCYFRISPMCPTLTGLAVHAMPSAFGSHLFPSRSSLVLIPVLVGPGSPLGPGLCGRSQSVGGLHSLAGACWSRSGVTWRGAVTLCLPTAASAPAV